jgi:hypothetical protein
MWRPDFAVRCCAKDPTILDELSEVIWLPRLDQPCEVGLWEVIAALGMRFRMDCGHSKVNPHV